MSTTDRGQKRKREDDILADHDDDVKYERMDSRVIKHSKNNTTLVLYDAKDHKEDGMMVVLCFMFCVLFLI